MKPKYETTMTACFIGYIVQAIVVNFVPLLFLTFHSNYHIPLSKITMLITVNFGIQLLIDLLSAGFIDKIGYRASIILAHIFSAIGLILLAILPELCSDPFTGIVIAVIFYAVGGGLIEVLISPIMESCPTDNKEKAMSLLHSFYSWGQVGVVLISTLFFKLFHVENWKILSLLWSLIPIINAVIFLKTPIAPLVQEGESGLTMKELFSNKLLWTFLLMMMSAGASEQAVSQWTSTFAEQALKVNKTVGDLAGPMTFAVLMGISRVYYGKYGSKINLDRFMMYSSILCIISYLSIAFIPHPILGFIGCGLCGLSVGILWPGTLSKAAASIKNGGTTMFALLALAGDLGCTTGPTLAGIISGRFQDNLRIGILSAIIFPLLLLLGLIICKRFITRFRH